jgi:hypothetical protein
MSMQQILKSHKESISGWMATIQNLAAVLRVREARRKTAKITRNAAPPVRPPMRYLVPR